MNAPAHSHRRHGVLLIWCGSVAMVLTGAFTFAWVKLPEWQPRWVIEHSPWPEPAVRAMIQYDARQFSLPAEHVLDWGAAIGPVLRQKFVDGSYDQRAQVIYLASTMLWDEREERNPLEDGGRLSVEAVQALRADLRWLAVQACADGSGDLRHLIAPVISFLRDAELLRIMYEWVAVDNPRGSDYLMTIIGDLQDPQAVPYLLRYLERDEHEGLSAHEELAGSILDRCLAPTQIDEVLVASHSTIAHVRAWAASAMSIVTMDMAVKRRLLELLEDSDDGVRYGAINAIIRKGVPPEFRPIMIAHLDDAMSGLRLRIIETIGELRICEGGEPLLARLTVEPELFLRISAIEALGKLEHIDAKPTLREIAMSSTDRLQGAAIVTLGTLRDPADFPLLLSLLTNDDDDIARKARIALGYLPLTPEQQKQVDVLWEAESDADTAAPASATTSPP